MASIQIGGTFRQSQILKGGGNKSSSGPKGQKRKKEKESTTTPLPPPVSSKQYQKMEMESTYADVASEMNGEHSSKEEDHFGFLYTDSEKDLHYDLVVTGKKARERELKWLKMMDNWEEWMSKKQPKVKERCRKGIPPSLRGRAWQLLSGGRKLLLVNAGLFDELISRPDNDVVINVIDKDLDRTFPSHVLFKKESGQESLRNVLKAYAMYNVKTGYCQAMAPVAATLLMHMTSEEAFWVLVQICEQFLPGYYSPGLHAFQIDALILKALLERYIPNIKKFMDAKLPPSPSDTPDTKGLDPMLYCTEWFMSIFSRSLPFNTVLRVWDMFFFEGPKVLFKVALAILYLCFSPPKTQKEVTGFFELTRKLRNLPIEVTYEETLVQEILKYPVHKEELHKYHIDQADKHFTEERVRDMEMQARRLRLHRRSMSISSDAAPSEFSEN